MATEHSTPARRTIREIFADLEPSAAQGRALDLFAQDEGFHSFAHWAAEQFSRGASIRFHLEQADLFLDPIEGELFETAEEAIAEAEVRPEN